MTQTTLLSVATALFAWHALLFGGIAYAATDNILVASFYSDDFQGQETANGEIFDQAKLTAASRTLRFGTRIKLKNPDTGSEVTVRINDRGPWIKGRDLDISKKAARHLGIVKKGVARIKATILSTPPKRRHNGTR